jgi:hypothetical protein
MVTIYLVTNPSRRQSNAETAFLNACEAALTRIGIDERTYGKSGAPYPPA